MANNHVNLQAVNKDGQTFSVQHTSTDSPILPAANLEHLQRIDPALVPFVMEETRLEAAARKKSNSQVNWFVFLEKISGVLVGGLVAVVGFLVGGYLVLQGHDWAGVGICGTTLGTIVTVLVTRQNSLKQETQQPAPQRKPRQPRSKKPAQN